MFVCVLFFCFDPSPRPFVLSLSFCCLYGLLSCAGLGSRGKGHYFCSSFWISAFGWHAPRAQPVCGPWAQLPLLHVCVIILICNLMFCNFFMFLWFVFAFACVHVVFLCLLLCIFFNMLFVSINMSCLVFLFLFCFFIFSSMGAPVPLICLVTVHCGVASPIPHQ